MLDLISTAPPQRSATDFFLDSHPFWFKSNDFLSPTFDSETHISELRTFVPLETVRFELESHLSSLNHEFLYLVNRDYTDFVNLSTKIVDVDAAIGWMRAPLLELREKIEGFRDSVERSLLALQSGLKQKSEAGATREILELMIDMFHIVSKVEELIKELPGLPTDCSDGDVNMAKTNSMNHASTLELVENGTSLRETQSMLLERVASEMNRLKFYIADAQNLPFIENMEKRIQNASLLLDASLGQCFVDGLEHRDSNTIYNCLRAYAALNNTHNAEEIFRTTVVAPLIQKIIPHGRLRVVAEASGSELENDYKQIKQRVEEDCKFLLEFCSAENSGLHVFDFLANSILKEVLLAIQNGKPGVFSPGRPSEFLKNYKSSFDFLSHLEGYCPSRSAVAKFRSEVVCVEFMKKWNVGVYFTLRFQEIAGVLDSALMEANIAPVQKTNPDNGNSLVLVLKQSVTLLESLRSCWREDIFVFPCSDKFLRLSLQLLSRYSNWLSSGVAARKLGNASSNPGCEWAISAAPGDFHAFNPLYFSFTNILHIIHDINCLAREICGDFLVHVLQLLSSRPTEVLDLVKQSFIQGGKSLNSLLPSVINTIIMALVKEADKELEHLERIPETCRMPNKPLPGYSPYVSRVLRPLETLLDGELAMMYLNRETKNEIQSGTATEITGRYHDLATKIISQARKRESALQKMRHAAQSLAGANLDVSDHNVSDTDKICRQLFHDIQEYGRNLSALGIDTADIPAYHSLWQCVAPPDRL